MRYVTICENVGARKVPGANHDKKYDLFVMQPGTAWQLGDDQHVVEVSAEEVKRCTYAWELRWIDGRTVAVFLHKNGTEYAQPVQDDPRARERKTAARERRVHAPGVAEEAPASRAEVALDDVNDEPGAKPRGRRPSALEAGPQRHRKRGGPRGGLKLEI